MSLAVGPRVVGWRRSFVRSLAAGPSRLAPLRLTKRHHPLQGQVFEVIRPRRKQIDLRLSDGSPMRAPREWTDVDGPRLPCSAERVFTLDSPLEVIDLIVALGRWP